MDKRIIYTNENGELCVVVPSPKWEGTLEELAAKDVPAGAEWRIVDVSQLPKSRNWRNAWTDLHPTETVDVDLVAAKEAHRQLIVRVAQERVSADAFGQKDFTQVKAEIDALDFDSVQTLDELYNLWPASIDKRTDGREYIMHEEAEISALR